MSTYYLGKASDGRTVSRKSTNPHFTHAAINLKPTRSLPNFGTSAEGARRNFGKYGECEVVEVRKVDAAEYRQALKAAATA